MSPTSILRESAADGVLIKLSGDGTLKATGIQDQVNKWVPVIREHKISIIAALVGAANDIDNHACFAWLIHYADRDSHTVSFSPMATHAEVLACWPGAVAAEPLFASSRRSATNAEAAQLRQLVEAVFRDDTDDDRNEALQAALADPDNALACYRAMADERGLYPTETDDRRTCHQCSNLKGVICSVATPGGVVSAPKGYRPALDLLQRCAGFKA